MEGIKRLAKAIKRASKIPYHDALEQAAQRAGYQNFRHARGRLADTVEAVASAGVFPIFLTAYWRSNEGGSGRETLRIVARKHWPTLLTVTELQRAYGLEHFRADAVDHFETREDLRSQAVAISKIHQAANSIAFMDATGLRPYSSRNRRAYHQLSEKITELPAGDHHTTWMDPDSKSVIWIDEPYFEGLLESREPWASERGLCVRSTTWAGIYAPGDATMYFTADGSAASLLDRIVRKLDTLPPPHFDHQWTGESGPYQPLFLSPGRSQDGRRKRGRAGPVDWNEVRDHAVPYAATMSHRVSWRPNGKMPIDVHADVGVALNNLRASSGIPSVIWQRLGRVRFELDEWVQREYDRSELSDARYKELYRRQSSATDVSDPVAALIAIETRIEQHYPDSPPRRQLLRRLRSCRDVLAKRARR